MDILERVRRSGVIGAGGSGFPIHVKLRNRVDTVIVNGVECEPLLGKDSCLMRSETGRILRGTGYILQCCGASMGYIAVNESNTPVLEHLSKAVAEFENISVFPIEDYYPAGDEYMLVHDITGCVVPEGGLPQDAGCFTVNVETAVNVCNAVENDRAVTETYLTCAGEVRIPSIVRTPVGASIGEMLDACGGVTLENAVVLMGGPISGEFIADLNTPVTKTTNAIVVLPAGHNLVQRKTISFEHMINRTKSSCCQCTLCTQLCPRYLLGHGIEPHRIIRQVGYGIDAPEHIIQNALLCSGCGLCEIFSCAVGLSPNKINTRIGEMLIAADYRPDFTDREIAVHVMRDYRKIPTSTLVERLGLGAYLESEPVRTSKVEPDHAEMLLKQGVGEPARPVVKTGEEVEAGSLLADVPEGVLGAAVHSSIEGTVTLIDEERIVVRH
jgi:Na+-translocating ferredoxin:NAD+ oxidoreductase RnfC subunit